METVVVSVSSSTVVSCTNAVFRAPPGILYNKYCARTSPSFKPGFALTSRSKTWFAELAMVTVSVTIPGKRGAIGAASLIFSAPSGVISASATGSSATGLSRPLQPTIERVKAKKKIEKIGRIEKFFILIVPFPTLGGRVFRCECFASDAIA